MFWFVEIGWVRKNQKVKFNFMIAKKLLCPFFHILKT